VPPPAPGPNASVDNLVEPGLAGSGVPRNRSGLPGSMGTTPWGVHASKSQGTYACPGASVEDDQLPRTCDQLPLRSTNESGGDAATLGAAQCDAARHSTQNPNAHTVRPTCARHVGRDGARASLMGYRRCQQCIKFDGPASARRIPRRNSAESGTAMDSLALEAAGPSVPAAQAGKQPSTQEQRRFVP
jgi:hypothetical protein